MRAERPVMLCHKNMRIRPHWKYTTSLSGKGCYSPNNSTGFFSIE